MQTSQILIWSISCSIITLLSFSLFIYYLTKSYNQKQKEYKRNLKLQLIENEKQILNVRIEVQEETIQKISREIHDNVNQLLTLSKLNLNSIKAVAEKEASQKIANAKDMITSAITELTNISRNLSSETINDLGLVKTLEQEAERINQLGDVLVTLEYGNEIPNLSKDVQLVLYRIFQESARNAIVHGKAKQITIKLDFDQVYLLFYIQDNGKGFDCSNLKTVYPSGHQGIRNMEKRAQLINGQFFLNSLVNIGTSILVRVPVDGQIKT